MGRWVIPDSRPSPFETLYNVHCIENKCQLQFKTLNKMSSIILTSKFKTVSTIFYFITYSIKSLHSISYQSQLRCFVLLQNSIREKCSHPWQGNKVKNVILFIRGKQCEQWNPFHIFIFLHNDAFCFWAIISKRQNLILRHSKKQVFTWHGLIRCRSSSIFKPTFYLFFFFNLLLSEWAK